MYGHTLEDVVKITIFLTDLGNFATVNEVMTKHFSEPYPARATIEVSGLPLGVNVEIEAIVGTDGHLFLQLLQFLHSHQEVVLRLQWSLLQDMVQKNV